MKNTNEENMLDLRIKKAICNLTEKELLEFEELENQFPEWVDDDSFELAAATLNLMAIDRSEAMPDHLRSKIIADSAQFFEPEVETESEEFQKTFEFAPKTSFWQSLGWGVAAFACIALAVNLYLTRFQVTTDRAKDTPPTTQTPTPKPDVNQMRDQFLAAGNDVLTVEVAKADPKSPVEITGDIVWSKEKQEGFMRFRGLPANDPNVSTYQLWIFDEAQDEKFPVDGGVFDVNKDGEIIVPIDAKINVKNPKLFAITKEKPGGVVVSDRKGIVAVAKV